MIFGVLDCTSFVVEGGKDIFTFALQAQRIDNVFPSMPIVDLVVHETRSVTHVVDDHIPDDDSVYGPFFQTVIFMARLRTDPSTKRGSYHKHAFFY